MISVAVMGYGTVGSGVVEIIDKNQKEVNEKAGDEVSVKYILDLRDFPGDPHQDKFIKDYKILVDDPEVDIVVEAMGGIEVAYKFTKEALLAGKSVCTSNKAVVAEHGPELLKIAKEHNCTYIFEASVGGGIPIIRPLHTSFTAEKIERWMKKTAITTKCLRKHRQRDMPSRIPKQTYADTTHAERLRFSHH